MSQRFSSIRESLHDRARAVGELPLPDAAARAHSEQLVARIRQELADGDGGMDFARFMELALYAPGLGYYSAGARKFGAAGDFVTAPEISPLFGGCVARQCGQVLAALAGGDILEAGAGSGALAADVLAQLDRDGCLPGHYFILELSAELRQRQRQTLQQRTPHLIDRVQWLDELPAAGFRGVILGNEILDAMPVQRFRLADQDLQLAHVVWARERFAWQWRSATPEIKACLTARLQGLDLASGYTSEWNRQAEAWVGTVARRLAAGMLLLIDYGFPRREFYHPQRDQGTLMCHYRHRAHDDPLILIGLQDITAHVDFTAMAEAGHEAGLSVQGYTHQAAFLLSTGLEEFLAQAADPLQAAQQAKKLTLPSEMGELFKVIALTRGVAGPLLGFRMIDQRRKL
jgi:SAM-dependent MidA family methyltransferase